MTFPRDLLDLAAQADPPDCRCDPAQHDATLCACGHRHVDHTPAASSRPCEHCACRGYVAVRHP